MELRNSSTIIATRVGDVTGDGVADTVWLTGTTTADSPLVSDITLMVQNGVTGRITQVALQDNMGYAPTIFLCDFTGDGAMDVKVSIPSGGSGGFVYTYIYSFANNQPRLLFSGDSYDISNQFKAYYVDGFTVVVEDTVQRQFFRIDVSQNPAAADLYNPDGTLKQPTEANVGPFIMAIPVILDESADTCSLIALTRVYGTFAADTLGYIQDYLSWDDGQFATVRKKLAIFPEDMS